MTPEDVRQRAEDIRIERIAGHEGTYRLVERRLWRDVLREIATKDLSQETASELADAALQTRRQ